VNGSYSTSRKNARYWLGIIAEHYGSLLISAICHGAIKELEMKDEEILRLRAALEAAKLHGEMIGASVLVADMESVLGAESMDEEVT
jgi:hypothetical protein